MDEHRLGDLLEQPNIIRKILNGYQGPFSLGVSSTAKPLKNQLGITLNVPVEGGNFPNYLLLDNEVVPIKVKYDWKAPKPLKI